MNDRVTKAVAIMDEAYLEWSRAREKGDKVAMEAANEKAVNAAIESGNPMEAFMLHKENGPRLTLQRQSERLAAETGLNIEVVSIEEIPDAKDAD